MTYRVVKIEPCEHIDDPMFRYINCRFFGADKCVGCRGDGTRMVDVAEVERPEFADGKCVPGDDGRPEWMPWDDRPISQVWVEADRD